MVNSRDISRREFFKKGGKTLLLTSLTGFTGWLTLRKPQKKEIHKCINRQLCGSCKKLNECILPAAESVKRSGKARSAQ